MKEDVIKQLKDIAERRAYYDDTHWYPEPDNADDTYEMGCKDGEIDLARRVLTWHGIEYTIEEF